MSDTKLRVTDKDIETTFSTGSVRAQADDADSTDADDADAADADDADAADADDADTTDADGTDA